jgi:hypothetical protein
MPLLWLICSSQLGGGNTQARFDAVAISPNNHQLGNFAINWLQNILT